MNGRIWEVQQVTKRWRARPVLKGLGAVRSLLVKGERAYLADDTTIGLLSLSAGRFTIIARGLSQPFLRALDEKHVYWSEGGAIWMGLPGRRLADTRGRVRACAKNGEFLWCLYSRGDDETGESRATLLGVRADQVSPSVDAWTITESVTAAAADSGGFAFTSFQHDSVMNLAMFPDLTVHACDVGHPIAAIALTRSDAVAWTKDQCLVAVRRH